MKRKLIISKKDKKELQKRIKTERNAKIYKRLVFISLKEKGIKNIEIALILGVRIETLTEWTNIFLKGGLKELCLLHYTGRRISKLEAKKELIKEYVEKEKVSTIAQLKNWLENNYQIFVEHSWLYRYCKKNSLFPGKKLV